MKILLPILGGIVVLGLLGVASGYYYLSTTAIDPEERRKVESIVAREPDVRPMYDAAIADGKLTTLEALDIVNKAVEIKDKQIEEKRKREGRK